MSDRNHFVASDPSDSFASYTGTEPPADSGRGLREGLPPAFRMRADAHYVEQLDGAAPAVIVQYIAVHVIDVSDAPADALPALVESIKRNGVLEPLVVQRNNGTYKTITGQKRLAAARAAGLRDVPRAGASRSAAAQAGAGAAGRGSSSSGIGGGPAGRRLFWHRDSCDAARRSRA